MSLDWVRRPRLRKKIIPINMENKQYNALFSFIWNIANDVLVHAFEKGDYKKIILPFMVLRRIDAFKEYKQRLISDVVAGQIKVY